MTLTGQIGLIPHGDNFVTRGIELVTRSHVHHVIIAIDDTWCIGAEPHGARIALISDFPTAIWSQFPLTPQQAAGAASWALARNRIPYNILDDALIGIECITGIVFPDWITAHYDNDKSYQCAQLADAALTKGAGIQVFTDGRKPGTVYPGSFEALFLANGWWDRSTCRACNQSLPV